MVSSEDSAWDVPPSIFGTRAGGPTVQRLVLGSQLRQLRESRGITAEQAAEAIRALSDLTCDGADFASLDDAREVIASLERIGQDLPQLCEQLARILVVQHEEGQIAEITGQDADFWVVEAVEALAAAGQAADMMAASLSQAGKTSGELRSTRLTRPRPVRVLPPPHDLAA